VIYYSQDKHGIVTDDSQKEEVLSAEEEEVPSAEC
jgi:hypothetical protein